MTTAGAVSILPRPLALIDRARRRNAPLTALVLLMLPVIALALIGLVVDPRVITGAPAWMKPLKFAISIAIYGGTLLWMLSFVPHRPRLVAVLSWGLLIGFSLEMALIVVQVMRGTTSHFNRATPLDSAIWDAMGLTIVVMWLLNVVVAVLLLRRRFAPPPILWGVRLGLLGAIIGMALAFLMTRPTAAQLAAMETTGRSPIVGAHAVDVADGGPGLPVVGWSTTGGDLRVGHFVGLHALQVLPLLGLALTKLAPAWLSMRDRSLLVAIAGATWIGLTGLVTWQALRGQPLVYPDATMLLWLGGLLVAAATTAVLVVLAARRSPRVSGFDPQHGTA